MTDSFYIFDLETAAVMGSKLLFSLQEGVGESELYETSKQTLSRYFELRGLDIKKLDFFLEHKCKFTMELNKEERA